MQEVSKNILEIIKVLDRYQVEYLIIGGVGSIIQGAYISTKDLDLIPMTTKENFFRLSAALRELGGRLRGAEDVYIPITPALLINMHIGTWVTKFGDLDILYSIPSGDKGEQYNFEKLFKDSRKGRVGHLVVRVASLKDIIASKRFAGRAKDLAVLSELEKLLEQQNEDPLS
jgi:hypothetical protein